MILPLLALVISLQSVLAQQSSRPAAKCTDTATFAQFSNSLGQDPCAVATGVGQVCDASFFIPAIAPSESYGNSPTVVEKNGCKCTSVYFSLLTICSACQDGDTVLWNIFTANCTTKSTETFPFQIPPGLAIPDWAYLPILGNGSVNVEAIKADHNPDRTGATTSSSISGSPTVTVAADSNNQSKNAGIIAGSIVGAVLVLTLLGLGLWYLFFRKRSSFAKQQEDKEKRHSDTPVIPVPFVVTEPSSPRPLKEDRHSARPSFGESLQGSEDGARQFTATSSPNQGQSDPATQNAESGTYLAPNQQRTLAVQNHDTRRSSSEQAESENDPQVLESQLREMQAQVDTLTTAMAHISREIAPPAYESSANNGGRG